MGAGTGSSGDGDNAYDSDRESVVGDVANG